jgi:adenine/guanine phosphoribosyltransferase-like PRPP-binding protein
MPPSHFTEPTTGYWQHVVEAAAVERPGPPWRFGYPARLPDGRVLMLPIRPLAGDPTHAVASLLVNQASLAVADTLGAMLAARLAALSPEVVIGLPTLGLTLAPIVARALGHTRYLPMGYSRKFWYDEALSAPVHSITSPTPGKRVYLDPQLLPLIEGRRVVLVDDAVSTGTTLLATWELIEALGGNVVVCGVAMRQGTRWADKLGAERAARLVGVFESPLLKAVPDGWVPRG